MQRKIAYHGEKFAIAFAREKSGACPGLEFFSELSQIDKAKMMALFRIAGDRANFHNREKFGDLGEGLFEFKSFQIRMPFGYGGVQERGVIVVSHGFIKKRNNAPSEEIARARRILKEDQMQAKLATVGKANQ